MAIIDHIERARAAEREGMFAVASVEWLEAAERADERRAGGAGAVYRRLAEQCGKINFQNHLTNTPPFAMVGNERETAGMKETVAVKETGKAVIIAPAPVKNGKGSMEERLFGAAPVEDEEGPCTELEVTEEADAYVIRIPKVLPVAALTQRMGRGERPTGLVYAPLRMKGMKVGFQGEGPNGPRTTQLVSKKTEFQLSFRLG